MPLFMSNERRAGPKPHRSCAQMDSATPRSMAHLEEQHQREMIRIHEIWQATKEQLRNKTRELEEVRAQMKMKQDGDGVVGQMHALTMELRDKLRFTELQLAAAREEGSVLASQMEGMRHQLGDAQAEATEQRELHHRQVSPASGERGRSLIRMPQQGVWGELTFAPPPWQAPQLMEMQAALSAMQQEKQELAGRCVRVPPHATIERERCPLSSAPMPTASQAARGRDVGRRRGARQGADNPAAGAKTRCAARQAPSGRGGGRQHEPRA